MPNRRHTTRRTTKRRPKRQREIETGVLGKLLVTLAVVAAIVLGVAIFFRVNAVEVQGNRIYSAAQVEEASGIEAGDNLLMVNKSAVVGSIHAQLPYVLTVSIGRILPDTIVIKIEESEVAGLVTADEGSQWYINTEGRILGNLSSGFNGQVITLEGFTVTAPAAGQQVAATEGMEENLEAALAVLEGMESSGLLNQVTKVNAEESYDLRLLCGEQYEVLLGGTDELDYKLWYLQEVLNRLESYQAGTIDVTLDQDNEAHFMPWVQELE